MRASRTSKPVPKTNTTNNVGQCTTEHRTVTTRMWANAQPDGRPAKYSWRPLFNAAKFGWRLECRAITQPRCETRWNVLGCPKLDNRSQPLVSWSSPYCEDMWGRHCCLTSFFSIVDPCLSCKDIADKVVRWCADGEFLAIFWVLHFQRAACSTFQTCILNSHYGHTMCISMVDIQSATVEIRRGKKELRRRKKKKPQDKNIMSATVTQGGHKKPHFIRKNRFFWLHVQMWCTTEHRTVTTRMRANAQPDGRPAKHRWRPLFNAAKFGWRPLLDTVQ